MNGMTKGALTTATAVTLWELGTRWWETRRLMGKYDHWRNYYSPELVQRADAVRQTYSIVSTGVTLHIDAYVQPESSAPVAVLYHGGGSYGRMATGIAMAIYDKGYTVVVGDRRGQGLSGGQRGMTTWSLDVQNAVDIARWAKGKFNRPQFLIGGSLGGPMSYYAAAAGAPADAIACLNLYDWTPDSPDVAEIFGPSAAAAAKNAGALTGLIGWLRLPWKKLAVEAWANILDERDVRGKAIWDQDVLTLSFVTVSFVHSLASSAPAVPFESNETPTLVINQIRDRMTSPAITQRNYERLGGPKAYAEVDYGHYAFMDGFSQDVATAADNWFRKHMPKS
jgi:alpha-beta hydrolase superfamily lysophospholipase